MKKVLLYILLLSGFYCFSQDTDEPVKVRFNLSAADRDGLQSSTGREFTIKGSPYLNEMHQEGLIINGETKTKALIRYNAYDDNFQVLDKDKKKSTVVKSTNIKVKLNENIYHLLTYKETVKDKALYYVPDHKSISADGNKKEGYFSALSEGETVLYLKTIKRIPKFKIPEHGYERFEPSAFLTLNHYYIKRKLRPAVRIKLSKKEVLFALNNKYDEIRTYIKKNRLKVKTEEEVVQIIKYYDTLD